jgi:hypothetical protein
MNSQNQKRLNFKNLFPFEIIELSQNFFFAGIFAKSRQKKELIASINKHFKYLFSLGSATHDEEFENKSIKLIVVQNVISMQWRC